MLTSTIRLPLFLKPKYETTLVRIGKKNDGGYSIGKNSLENTKKLFSFGLNDDWSFDEEFSLKSNSEVFVYDPNVNMKFWIRKFLRNFKEILLLKRRSLKEINEIFSYLRYKKFFSGNNKIHELKLIAPKDASIPNFKIDQITDLHFLMKNIKEKNIFMKIDIEGSEYRILDQLINYQQYMTGLVIEFHNCDLHVELIREFVSKFELQLVHIHVNNWGLIDKNRFASSLEMTFSPKEFNKEVTDALKSYPLLIDQPCNPKYQDNKIEFF